MLAETMEDEEGSANGKRGGRRRCKGRAATEDGEKIDGRAGPKSEHVVLSKSQCSRNTFSIFTSNPALQPSITSRSFSQNVTF